MDLIPAWYAVPKKTDDKGWQVMWDRFRRYRDSGLVQRSNRLIQKWGGKPL